MIVSIAKPTDSHGARIRYAADPGKGAEFVASNIPGAENNPLLAIDSLERVAALRPSRSKPSAHFSLRARDDEYLTSDQWSDIAEMAVRRLGFEEAPWVAYLHHDKGAPHLHVIASYVTLEGDSVANSWDRLTAMRLAREVEQRFDLNPLPTPDMSLKQRRQGEFHNASKETPRLYLQAAIARARDASTDFPAFAAALERDHVQVKLARTSTGRVLGVSYTYQEAHFSGSQLGRDYAWPALRQAVPLRPEHEEARLLGERAPSHDRAERPASLTATPSVPLPLDQLRPAIASHLEALGAERYTVIIIDRASSKRTTRANWSAEDVVHAAGFLRAQNEGGAEILIRPFPPTITFTLTDAQVATARELGLTPAAVVRTGADANDVWFRPPRALRPDDHRLLAAGLVVDLGASPDRMTNLAHLPGFAVRAGGTAQLVDHPGTLLPASTVDAPARPPAPIPEAYLVQALEAAGLPWLSGRPWPTGLPAPDDPPVTTHAAAIATAASYRDHLAYLLQNPNRPLPLPAAPPELARLAIAADQHAVLLSEWHRRLSLAQIVNHPHYRSNTDAWNRLAFADHSVRAQTALTIAAYNSAGIEPLLPLPAPPVRLRDGLLSGPSASIEELRLAAGVAASGLGTLPAPLRADHLRALTPETILRRAERASGLAEAAVARYRADEDPRRLFVALDRAAGYHHELGRRAHLPQDPRDLASYLAAAPPKDHQLAYLEAHARTGFLDLTHPRPTHPSALLTPEAFRDHLLQVAQNPRERLATPPFPQELDALALAVDRHASLLSTWYQRSLAFEGADRERRPTHQSCWELHSLNCDLREQTAATLAAYAAAGIEPLLPVPAAPAASVKDLVSSSAPALHEVRQAARIEIHLRDRHEDLPSPPKAHLLFDLTSETLAARTERATSVAEKAIARYQADPAANPRPLLVAVDRALAYQAETERRAPEPQPLEPPSLRSALAESFRPFAEPIVDRPLTPPPSEISIDHRVAESSPPASSSQLLAEPTLAQPFTLPPFEVSRELPLLDQAVALHSHLVRQEWIYDALAAELGRPDIEARRPEIPESNPPAWDHLAALIPHLQAERERTLAAYLSAGVQPDAPLRPAPLSFQELLAHSDPDVRDLHLAARLEVYVRSGESPQPTRESGPLLERLAPATLLARTERANATLESALAAQQANPSDPPHVLVQALDRARPYNQEVARRAGLPDPPTLPEARTNATFYRSEIDRRTRRAPKTSRTAPHTANRSGTPNLLALTQKTRARLRHLSRPHEIPSAAGREVAKLAAEALPGPSLVKRGPFAVYDALRVDRSAPLKAAVLAESALRSALAAAGLGSTAASVAAAAILAAIKLIPKVFDRDEDDPRSRRGPSR